MRIRIAHETVYRYEKPAKSVIQTLRLTPRSHDGQHVIRWRINVDQDVRLSEIEDAFGNIGHVFSAAGSIETMRVTVEGEVETQDRAGVLQGTIERFPVALYLRETALSRTDEALCMFGKEAAGQSTNMLSVCHALMEAIHDTVAFDSDPGVIASDAPGAFKAGRGTAQDLAHIFIASARGLKIPARYVSGLIYLPEAAASKNAAHAWAEAHVEGFGWVAFDPCWNVCPMDHHVRVAMGLDYLGAAPVRGARYGGEGESFDVHISMSEKLAQRQAQRQTQN
jgi:transglutaminase-like putative cysteine protease